MPSTFVPPDKPVEMKCLTCDKKVIPNNPTYKVAKNGTPMQQGTCPTCGRKLSTFISRNKDSKKGGDDSFSFNGGCGCNGGSEFDIVTELREGGATFDVIGGAQRSTRKKKPATKKTATKKTAAKKTATTKKKPATKKTAAKKTTTKKTATKKTATKKPATKKTAVKKTATKKTAAKKPTTKKPAAKKTTTKTKPKTKSKTKK